MAILQLSRADLLVEDQDCSIFPDRIKMEGIWIDAFETKQQFFKRLLYEAKKSGKSLFAGSNIHNMNMIYKHPRLKSILGKADVFYCDGAGIIVASKILGEKSIQKRFANGDWLFELFDYLCDHQCTIYYLGGEPGIVEKGIELYHQRRPDHTIMGYHHGFILKDPSLECQVIDHINQVRPDILFVGMGCPLQEFWIDDHKDELNVGLFYPIGASMDYLVGKVPRCPIWLGNMGLEWLFRLSLEPRRLFHRYIVGNPWFLSRITVQAIKKLLF